MEKVISAKSKPHQEYLRRETCHCIAIVARAICMSLYKYIWRYHKISKLNKAIPKNPFIR